MKNVFVILSIFIVGMVQSHPFQVNEDERSEYFIRRPVKNSYDISFFENLYLESVKQFNISKKKVIERYMESFGDSKKFNESVIEKWNLIFTNPQLVQDYFRYYAIDLEIYGVKIMNADTSLFRKLCDNAKSTLVESQFETTLSWGAGDFISLPTLRNEQYLNPEHILFIYDMKEKYAEGVKDGKYVMYYEPIFDYRSQSFKTNVPYCHFEIRNKKINGQAIFFSHLGDTIAQGAYLDGFQNGKWSIKLPYTSIQNSDSFEFAELTLDGKIIKNGRASMDFGWCEYDLEFSSGQLNGEFVFKKNGILRSIGKFNLLNANQLRPDVDQLISAPMSEWKIFYGNGQLASKFEFKPIITMNKSVVFPWAPDFSSTFKFYLLHRNKAIPGYDEFFISMHSNSGSFVNDESDSLIKNDFSNDADSLYMEGASISIEQKVLPPIFGFSDDITVCTEQSDELMLYRFMLSKTAAASAVKNDFILYHKNGQLMLQLNYSDDGELTKVSPLFDCEGKIITRYLFNRDHTSAIVIVKLQKKTFRFKVTYDNEIQQWCKIRFKPLFGFSEIGAN